MGPLESSHQHGPPLLGRVRVPARSPTSSLVCSPPTPSVPSAAAPVVPCRRPTLAQGAGSTEGLPGGWAVLFQRAVVVDPVGCASLLAHHAETAVAFRLHEALGTQHERYFGAAMPTAHSLACLRIGDRVAARAARLATGVGGLTLHRTGFAPVGRQTKFRESPHHHSPSTSLAWSHRAPTPLNAGSAAGARDLLDQYVPAPPVCQRLTFTVGDDARSRYLKNKCRPRKDSSTKGDESGPIGRQRHGFNSPSGLFQTTGGRLPRAA